MDWIDVIIPAFGGLLLVFAPMKKTDDPQSDRKIRQRTRFLGLCLILGACFFTYKKLMLD